jgi:hypothetical protein
MLRYRIFMDTQASQTTVGATTASNGGSKLKIAWRPDVAGVAGEPAAQAGLYWREEVLLDDVNGLAFEYFSKPEGSQGIWTESWLRQIDPPLLVRLSVRFASGNADDWPDFVVRPRITAPADCQFDMVSRRCR